MRKPYRSIGILMSCLQLLSGCAGQPDDDFQCQSCDAYPPIERMPGCQAATPNPRWDNLVFQGGGVKGIAYGGALEELNSSGHLEPVQRVAGASAGAITATLLALGNNACEVSKYAGSFPYEKFEDGKGLEEIPRLVEEYGLYKGDFFECSMRCIVEDSLGSMDATFETLARRIDDNDPSDHGRPLKHLYVVATNLSTEDSVTFSHESPQHSSVPIADAVRKSMSIPLYFTARTLPPGNDLFIDGGVVRNYPINIFDDKVDEETYQRCLMENPKDTKYCDKNWRTLGLHLSEGRKAAYETDNIVIYTKQLFNTITAAQIDMLCASPYDVRRTVFIDTFDTKATDFDLSNEQVACLKDSGREHMARFLDEGGAPFCPEFILPRSPGSGLNCMTTPVASDAGDSIR